MKKLDVGYINTLTYKYETNNIKWYEDIILYIYSIYIKIVSSLKEWRLDYEKVKQYSYSEDFRW